MSELVRFGVSLEQDLLDAFDQLSQRRGYSSRSEALRRCLRKELDEADLALPDGLAAGALVLVYNHHDSDLPRSLTAMQHEAHDLVLATMHVHLDQEFCLEVLTLRGPVGQVQKLAERLISTRGVLKGNLSLSAIGGTESEASA